MAKMWSAFGTSKVLAVADPIFGMRFQTLMLVVGLVEVVVASMCLLSRNMRTSLLLVAWLATSFLLYRLGSWWIGWEMPCGCLGNLADAIHISPETADNFIKAVLAYLLVGSYGLLFWRWKHQSDFGGLGARVGQEEVLK